MIEPGFLLALGEAFARIVTPAAFAQIIVPRVDFFRRRPAAILETPFENVLVFATEFRASHDILVLHAEKGATATVEPTAKRRMVIRRKFALRVELDLVEHPSEIDQTANFVMWTAKTVDFHGTILPRVGAHRNSQWFKT